MRVHVAVGLSALFLACSADGSAPKGAAADAGPAACPDCAPTFPTGTCPAGSAPLPGTAPCTKVGMVTCAERFAVAESGWGCAPVITTDTCKGATRARLGDTSCAPVGDCNAAFPPADAKWFVDDDGTEDAAHFTTIAAALAAAKDGDTIAIAGGRYVEAIAPTRNVVLVGRCAAEVIVASPGKEDAGVTVKGGVTVGVRGITLREHRGGIVVTSGTVEAKDVVIEENRDIGIAAFGPKAKMTFEGGVIRKTKPMDDGRLGRGVELESGSTTKLVDATVEDNAELGVLAENANVELDGVIIRRTAVNGAGAQGRGLSVSKGGSATVRRSFFQANHDAALSAQGADTKLAIEDTVITDSLPTRDGNFGRGIVAKEDPELTIARSRIAFSVDTGLDLERAKATIEDVVIEGTKCTPKKLFGFGIFARDRSSLSATRTAIVGNRGMAVIATASEVTLDGAAVLSTTSEDGGLYGAGLVAAAGARMNVRQSVVDDAQFGGVFAVEAGTSIVLERTLVSHVKPQAKGEPYGHGVVALEGARIDLVKSAVRAADAVALLYAGATGMVTGSLIEDNGVGIHTTGGTALVEGAREPSDLELLVSPDTRLVGNATRIGSGEVALPSIDFSRK